MFHLPGKQMKKCTYCGKEYPDEHRFCAIDREPLDWVGLPPALATGFPPYLQKNLACAVTGHSDAATQRADVQNVILAGGFAIFMGIISLAVSQSHESSVITGGVNVISIGSILHAAIHIFAFVGHIIGGKRASACKAPRMDNAQMHLELAAQFQSWDPTQAVQKYQEVVRKFPNTVASEEAQRNIKALTATKG